MTVGFKTSYIEMLKSKPPVSKMAASCHASWLLQSLYVGQLASDLLSKDFVMVLRVPG